MIDLVLTAERTHKFHNLQMAEYPYRTSSVTECPPSNCSPASRSDGYNDRLPAFQWLVPAATRTTAANQMESEKIALYSSLSSEIEYESLTAEHTQSFADYGCQVSSTLLGVFVRGWWVNTWMNTQWAHCTVLYCTVLYCTVLYLHALVLLFMIWIMYSDLFGRLGGCLMGLLYYVNHIYGRCVFKICKEVGNVSHVLFYKVP